MTDEQKISGTAKDGKVFDADSEEVKKYLEEFPDVELEAAIGSVIETYNDSLPKDTEEED